MPGLKEVKNKIEGVSKTAQITRAMKMVASAKLRGAQERMEAFRAYAEKFSETMQELSGSLGEEQPLMAVRPVKTIELVVCTSDRGLCGSFNSNILRLSRKLIHQYEQEGKEVRLVTIGNKATQGLKQYGIIRKSYMDIMGSFQMFHARDIAQDLTHTFLEGGADRVDLVYARFKSMATQTPTHEVFLPIQPPVQDEAGSKARPVEYLYEPSPTEIMEGLLPLYLNVQIFHSMIEVAAGEHAARMRAMENATNACGDMIHDLKQLYNKARQAAITADLMDIVGGAEALRG
jgi:F-type H+-transporting ATPase subunit gamma